MRERNLLGLDTFACSHSLTSSRSAARCADSFSVTPLAHPLGIHAALCRTLAEDVENSSVALQAELEALQIHVMDCEQCRPHASGDDHDMPEEVRRLQASTQAAMAAMRASAAAREDSPPPPPPAPVIPGITAVGPPCFACGAPLAHATVRTLSSLCFVLRGSKLRNGPMRSLAEGATHAGRTQEGNAPVQKALSPLEIVGSKVEVYWKREKEWFKAKVTHYMPGEQFPFFLKYDDGDQVRSPSPTPKDSPCEAISEIP